MAQYEMSLRDYQRIVLKRKKTILASVLLVGVMVLVFTKTPKVHYEAMSKIRVMRVDEPAGLYTQMLRINEGDDIATHQVSLKGQPTLIAVAHKLKLFPEIYLSMPVREVIETCFNLPDVASKVKDLGDQIKVEQEGNTNIITIRTRDLDPVVAQRLADAVAEQYKALTDEKNSDNLRKVRKFLDEESRKAREEVTRYQKSLQEQQSASLGLLTVGRGEFGTLVAEKAALEERAKAVRSQITRLQTRRDDAEGGVVSFVTTDVGDSRTIENLNTQLVTLQLEMRQLLVYLKPEAPKIKDIEARISSLIGGIVRELEEIEGSSQQRNVRIDATLRESPEVEMQLSKAESGLKAAQLSLQRLAEALRDLDIKEQEQVTTVLVEERAAGAKTVRQPGKFLKTLVGCIVGCILGFLWAIVLEVLDTSIDTIEDVEEFLETPVMGVIPHMDLEELKAVIRENNPDITEEQLAETPVLLTTQLGPKSPSAEAFRTLRTNLEFAMAQRNGSVLAIASAALGEGKTSTSCNLAVALAQNGKRTVLVDADLRRPAVFKTFGLEKQPGFSEVLQGRVKISEAVRTISDVFLGHMSTEDVLRTPGLENLHIITCGGIPSNPAELLSQEPTRAVIQELSETYDVVIFDSPPILPVADGVILGSQVDGVVLVYQVGKVGRGVLKRAKVQLDNVGAKVWGIVLNDLTPELSEFKDESQYYRHYYYKEEPPHSGGWLSRTFRRNGGTG